MRKNCSRVIIENFFEPCVLFLLLERTSYGYELKSKLDAQCGCLVNIGNLYRGLSKLQKNGHIEKMTVVGNKGPPKQMYNITSSGKALLALWITDLNLQSRTIQKLVKKYNNALKK